MNKVRVGSLYAYDPVMMDVLRPPFGNPEKGAILRVINKFGCPKANTCGMCYVETMDGEFMGMVCTNSLTHVTRKNKHYYIKE
jgi:hypothetical protein